MYIGIDLGSTNIKAAIYDKEFNLIDKLPFASFRLQKSS